MGAADAGAGSNADLIAKLGMGPARNVDPSRDVQKSLSANKPDLKPLFDQTAATQGATQIASVNDAVATAKARMSDMTSKGVWGQLGDAFAGALKIANTGHAVVVSTIKEAGDAVRTATGYDPLAVHANPFSKTATFGDGAPSQASPSEWWSQAFGDHQIGFGDVLNQSNPKMPRAMKIVGGIVGDVVTDPLTYIAPGADTVAQAGAQEVDRLLAHALESGGRNVVGTATRDAVERAGLSGSEAAQRLVVDAAQRGRGAFTSRALAKSGLAADEIAKLGIPKFGKTFMGALIPGTHGLADASEAFKGAIKSWVGSKAASEIARGLRFNADRGLLKSVNTIRDLSAPLDHQLMAVDNLTARSQANRLATNVAKQLENAIMRTPEGKPSILGKVLRAGGAEKGLIVGSVETGTHTAAGLGWRDALDKAHQIAVDHGVRGVDGLPLPYRENYVPHFMTQDAVKLGDKNSEVKDFLKKLGSDKSFQKARVSTGTIAEKNTAFRAAFPEAARKGVNLFEIDPGVILAKYVAQVSSAVGDAAHIGSLEAAGHVLPKTLVTLQHDKGWLHAQPEFQAAAKAVEKNVGEHLAAADQVIRLRHAQAQVAVDGLTAQKSVVRSQIDQIDRGLKDLGRTAKSAHMAQAKAESQLTVLQSKLDAHLAVAKTARGEAKVVVRAAIADAKAKIVEASKAVGEAKAKVAFVMDQKSVPLGERVAASKGLVAETKRLSDQRALLVGQHDVLGTKLDALNIKNTALGLGDTAPELRVAASTQRVTEAAASVKGAAGAAKVAQSGVDFAVADKAVTLPILDAQLADIKFARSNIVLSSNIPARLEGKARQMVIGDFQLQLARDVLGAADTPAAHIIASMDAAATIAESKFRDIGDAGIEIKSLLDTIRHPEWSQYIVSKVDHGYKELDATRQIPNWLSDTVNVVTKMKDPHFWDAGLRVYDQGLNLFKGYALATPRFVTRSTFGNLTKVYLEAGVEGIQSVKMFEKFNRWSDRHPDTYVQKALDHFQDPELVGLMQQAREIQIATGTRVGDVFTHEVGKRGFNPLSADNKFIQLALHANSKVESSIRGGHALDVLRRGGSADLALATVEKWHFNYSDLTSFDRGMKRVIPFWTFYSKNMALEASTFAKTLPRLNRTYFNLQRNMAIGQKPDTNVPENIISKFGIQVSGGGSGDTAYLTPDVPALRGVEDITNLVSGKFSKVGFSPLINVAKANLTNADPYTDQKFKDWTHPVSAPGYMRLPGVQQLLEHVGLVQDGGKSGDLMTTDRTRSVINNLFPQAQMSSGSSKSKLNVLGLGVTFNTDKTRKAVDFQRRLEAKKLVDVVNALAKS